MNFFDWAFINIFRLVSFLIKSKQDAKWSAFLYFNFYMAALAVSICSLSGILYPNSLSQYLKTNTIEFVLIIGIVSPVIFGIRYFKIVNIKQLYEQNEQIWDSKRHMLKLLFTLFIIGVPLMSFFLYRTSL